MTLKLFHVRCRGMQSSATEAAHGNVFVVALDATQAYQIVREDLDARGLGFDHERELLSVELVAESAPFPSCRTRLYLPPPQEPEHEIIKPI